MAKEKEVKEKKYFFRDFKAELKKVIWPTLKQVVNSTIAVITIVLITAVIVFVLDLAFESMNKFGINKVKEVISTSENDVVDDANVTEEDADIVDDTSIEENTIEE